MTPTRRLVQIVTIADSFRALGGQFAWMREQGFDVHAVSSPGAYLDDLAQRQGVVPHVVDMTRAITPWKDARALSRLTALLREIRPDVVHAHTPKAGFLAMLAARRARVPAAIYHLRGLRHVTARGWKRQLLIACDRLACRLADDVLCVGPSLRDVAIAERIAPPAKLHVLLNGGHGLDCDGLFDPGRLPAETRNDVRRRYGIPPEAVVIGFVGRIARDKGIVELAAAWDHLRRERPFAHLLIVGPEESNDPVPREVLVRLATDRRVHLTGPQDEMPPLYQAMDVLCLPSYREGLAKVLLEGAAMRLPVVATRIPGCVDSVVEGETGLLVPPRDGSSLAVALGICLDDAAFRERCGRAGRERVVALYSHTAIWHELKAFYERTLARRARPERPALRRAA